MQFSLDENTGRYQIRGYQPGKIQVNDEFYTHSIIISPEQLITDWPVTHIADLQLTHLQIIDSFHPKVVLLGTGVTLQFPHPELLAHFTQRQIGIEVMNTAAACRTFSALTAEGRPVVAALINTPVT